MNILSYIMAAFALLGAVDRIFKNKLGLGKQFEKGLIMFGTLALSMIGMIVLSPAIASLLEPLSNALYASLKIDPSIIPASIFANDMGGAALSLEVSKDSSLGGFNALVVSSMMGATVSFTIPYALSTVEEKQHRWLLLGLLCGIVTVPIGAFVSGLILKIAPLTLLYNLLPLVLFSVLVALGLLFFSKACVKIFRVLGICIKIVVTLGLALGILKFLTGIEVVKGLASLEEGADICLNICVVMTGAFPLLFVISKLLKKPLSALAHRLSINENSALGFVSTFATSVSTFEAMGEMDDKGAMLNSAFAVSASFVLADHLAFTLAFDSRYLPAVMIGKLVSGILALATALLIYKRISLNKSK